jgi:hypothetical protein
MSSISPWAETCPHSSGAVCSWGSSQNLPGATVAAVTSFTRAVIDARKLGDRHRSHISATISRRCASNLLTSDKDQRSNVSPCPPSSRGAISAKCA